MVSIKLEISPTFLMHHKEDIVIHIGKECLLSSPQVSKSGTTLFQFMESLINQLRQNKQIRTSETYTSALRSFKSFKRDSDLYIEDVTPNVIEAYECWLKLNGVVLNTVSFYMRILRATYNRAVTLGLTVDKKPFAKVYTGSPKTIKRAISIADLRTIKNSIITNPDKRFARDMFLFSFYTRGMSFIDMANLKKSDLHDGTLRYQRSKTRQRICLKWQPYLQDIIDKYPKTDRTHLLPIITERGDERKQYLRIQHQINENLSRLTRDLGLSRKLTMYVARHTWATIAKSQNIPTAIISDCMGHNSEKTTQIYLNTISAQMMDDADERVATTI